jgi:hypothetical protein
MTNSSIVSNLSAAFLLRSYKLFMMRVLTLLVGVLYVVISDAQVITANDSVSTGMNDTAMVFYSLATKQKTYSSNVDWHLAVSVRPTQFPEHPLGGTTIRINEANGVQVFISPNANASGYIA